MGRSVIGQLGQAIIERVSRALGIAGGDVMGPSNQNTDEVLWVIDIGPLLYPDHIYRVQPVARSIAGAGVSVGVLPPGAEPFEGVSGGVLPPAIVPI